MKTLSEIAKEVSEASGQPHRLSELKLEIAVMYTELSDKFGDIQIKKAEYWKYKEFDFNGELRPKPVSDKSVEMHWNLTEKGKEDIKLRYSLKALEKLLSAINSAMFTANTESRNQY